MRLIDADKLKEDMSKRQIENRDLNASFYEVINEQPTVDAVPTDFHDKCQQLEIQKRFKLEEDYRSMERTVDKLIKALAEAEPVKIDIERFKQEIADYTDESGYVDIPLSILLDTLNEVIDDKRR